MKYEASTTLNAPRPYFAVSVMTSSAKKAISTPVAPYRSDIRIAGAEVSLDAIRRQPQGKSG